VPADDPGALASELSRMLGNKDLRDGLGRAARERVERHFGFDAFRERTLALYRHVCPGASSPQMAPVHTEGRPHQKSPSSVRSS